MPLYREWSSDPYSLAAIWKIEEPESFFLERTGMEALDIKAEKRRIERAAGRFLLRHLQHDFPLLNIQADEHDKPRIADNEYYFSISHSWPYVAAVVSPLVECGIDIQCWHPRMEALQHKFLSTDEQAMVNNDSQLITLFWSVKEAAYKWQGRRGVEFSDHMNITSLSREGHNYHIDIFMQLTEPQMAISAEGLVKQDFACAFIVNNTIIHPFNKIT